MKRLPDKINRNGKFIPVFLLLIIITTFIINVGCTPRDINLSNGKDLLPKRNNSLLLISFLSLYMGRCDDPFCTNPEIKVLDDNGDTGEFSELQLFNETPRVAYYSQNELGIKFAYCDDNFCDSSNTVFIQGAIDFNTGTGQSVLLELYQGIPRIAYSNDGLFLVVCDDFLCTSLASVEEVVTTDSAGKLISMALNGDLPILAHTSSESPDGGLFLEICHNPFCTNHTTREIFNAANSGGADVFPNALALDQGIPVIIHRAGGFIDLVRCSDTICTNITRATIYDLGGNLLSGQIDMKLVNGNPLLLFDELNITKNINTLTLLNCLDSMCNASIVTEVTDLEASDNKVSLALDQDIPVISTILGDSSLPKDVNRTLSLIRCLDQNCNTKVINGIDTETTSFSYNSIQLQDSNNPVIAYYTNGPTSNLNIAFCLDTSAPTFSPSNSPSISPTTSPTSSPTIPTVAPSNSPSLPPTSSPTLATQSPTTSPTNSPTNPPSLHTSSPTYSPTLSPTLPSNAPTNAPSLSPTFPSNAPTNAPTVTPTMSPTRTPTTPTVIPTGAPTHAPTIPPTNAPTSPPTKSPTAAPTPPTATPTNAPTDSPTYSPTSAPTGPTHSPTNAPTNAPTPPTATPTNAPTVPPTLAPTGAPSPPSASPTNAPTIAPSPPSLSPTETPTNSPTPKPVREPLEDWEIALIVISSVILVSLLCLLCLLYLLRKLFRALQPRRTPVIPLINYNTQNNIGTWDDL